MGRGREERIQRREHRLPALEPVPLQTRELELQELVEHLRLGEQLVDPLLLLPAYAPRVLGLGLQQVGEPQTLRLARGVHILVGDAADVDVAQVTCDFLQRPVLRARVLANGTGPDDAVDVVGARRVVKPIAFGGQCADFFTLEEVEGVYARCAVSMRAERVNVPEQGGIGCTILELVSCV